jgi:hypothetical protein
MVLATLAHPNTSLKSSWKTRCFGATHLLRQPIFA